MDELLFLHDDLFEVYSVGKTVPYEANTISRAIVRSTEQDVGEVFICEELGNPFVRP